MLRKECEEDWLHTLKNLRYNIIIFLDYNLYYYIFSANRKKQCDGYFKKEK